MIDVHDKETIDAFPVKRGRGRPRVTKEPGEVKKDNKARQKKFQQARRAKEIAMKFAVTHIQKAIQIDDLVSKTTLEKFVYFLGGGVAGEEQVEVHYNKDKKDVTKLMSYAELIELIVAKTDIIRVK